MDVKIEQSWKNLLKEEFEQPYFYQLTEFVRSQYRDFVCYPPARQIFAAFDSCPVDSVKVVIIGQDPYHGVNQANGLAFSVSEGVDIPPSLVNIFKEVCTDIQVSYPQTGNLERWAKQGVLLLNATLTVRANQPGSHQHKGWETFTNAVIQKLSKQSSGIVFMLWGSFAKGKQPLIDTTKHCVLSSGHPSPLSANRGYWFGNQHFSKANTYLQSQGKSPIKW